MKIGSPQSRYELSIKRGEKVLDVGSGNNPHPRADVLVDKFIESDLHRSGNVRMFAHQKLVQADGEHMPFEDNSFDYIISAHVLEHVENPTVFLEELQRVGRRGYIETPSLLGEFLVPKATHQWLLLDLNGKICMVSKERAQFQLSHDLGKIFQHYFQFNSWGYKIMQRTHPALLTMNYEWKDSIDFVVEPEDDEIMSYFTDPWHQDMFKQLMPQRSIMQESWATLAAVAGIFKSVVKSKVIGKLKLPTYVDPLEHGYLSCKDNPAVFKQASEITRMDTADVRAQ